MIDGWKTCVLGDIIEIIGGGTPKTNISEYWNGNIPWLSVKDFNNDDRYVYSTEKYITQAGLNNSSTKLLHPDDIIISARGTVGELAMIPFHMAFNQSCYGIRGDKEIVTQTYLYYILKYNTDVLKKNTHGSVFDTITRETFYNIELELPALEEQKKIASILSALDDKIELNKKINKTLEEMAKAIFKSWFVDFEPWGGKMPGDWKIVRFNDVAEFVSGYSYKSKELQSSDIAMATIKNFEREGGFKVDGFKEIVITGKIKESQYTKQYDILVAHTDLTQNAEVIGNAEMILSSLGYEQIIFSCDIVKVLPRLKNMTTFILIAYLKSLNFKKHAFGYINGTTVLHLGKKALPDYEILLPTDEILECFNCILEPLYRQMSNNINENIHLSSLRDTLLPKLMSGEIRVK